MRIEIGEVRLDLSDDQVESLRRQLAVWRPETTGLLDAAQVAQQLGVSREWVYSHAEELGGQRIGSGSRPRLRFDPTRIGQTVTAEEPETKPTKRRTRTRNRVELLEVRGSGTMLSNRKERPPTARKRQPRA
jgi:hypothetical protein